MINSLDYVSVKTSDGYVVSIHKNEITRHVISCFGVSLNKLPEIIKVLKEFIEFHNRLPLNQQNVSLIETAQSLFEQEIRNEK